MDVRGTQSRVAGARHKGDPAVNGSPDRPGPVGGEEGALRRVRWRGPGDPGPWPLPSKELILIPHRIFAFVAFLPLTLACQSAFAAPGGGAPRAPAAGLLPPAKNALDIQIGENSQPSLARVLQELTASTGVSFTAVHSVRRELESVPCGVLTSVTIPPAEAWVWVESLLQNEGFSLGVLSANAPCLVAVYPLQPRSGEAWVRAFTTVSMSEIEALAEHPALLVSTTLELPHTDVRQLGNSLRGLTTDPTGQQNVVPVGNSNSVILTGTGRQVLQLATLLREVDAAVAAAEAKRPQEPKPAGESGATTPR
jgi:hypothetical protein